ncbi:MAG: L-aspartate oxidase [Actinomycetota bacterium]
MTIRRIPSDVIVVGTGVAGLTTALSMPSRRVTLITKTELGGGSTWWAQGGIAAALSVQDSPRLHAEDTLAVGAGLNDPRAVDALAENARSVVRHLRERGARFDVAPDGTLVLGREAGHSVRRIIHTDGDTTGAEVSRALVEAVQRSSHIDLQEHTFAADLVMDGGRVYGVTARLADGERVAFMGSAVVLATGGIGRVYANTTNPPEVTGDGLAMASRTGADIVDAEFVQFHPTALDTGVDPMPLLTEALRGEGAVLVDETGDRFMVREHPDADLAPRDVVARAVWQRLRSGKTVSLDARSAVGASFSERFPTVFRLCHESGIDPRDELIPVAPAAHFHMGGIATDLEGRSSLPGLWAVGEVSRSGVHGANRLASNSLLEGLVFGEAVAADVVRISESTSVAARRLVIVDPGPEPEIDGGTITDLRRVMWEGVGVVRVDASLRTALDAIARIRRVTPAAPCEAGNMVDVARLLAEAALSRTESRGAHFRSDFPDADESRVARVR